jgi:hypothetical protein
MGLTEFNSCTAPHLVVGDEQAGGVDALGLVRQQVAALHVHVVGDHEPRGVSDTTCVRKQTLKPGDHVKQLRVRSSLLTLS